MQYTEDNLQMYFDGIKEYPIYDVNTQKELIKQAQAGNEAAREQIIMSNSRFVITFANQYKNVVGMSLAELISEGNMGLICAIQKFDSEHQVSFTSYAAWWIRHYILRSIHQSSKLVRLPMNKVRLLQQLKREQLALITELEISDTNALEKAGKMFNMTNKQVAELTQCANETFSLDREIQQDTDGHMTFLDAIIDEKESNIDEKIEQKEQEEVLYKYISKIPAREAAIIKQRFGLEGLEPKSLNDLSKVYGITKERIRQLEIKGIQRMKKMHRESELMTLAA